jgi:DDE superfamily endonuclease
MELYHRLEQILKELRPVFSREASFNWFVLLLWGVLLSTQTPAVTSYVNALGLSEGYYHRALHWFNTSAFSINELCRRWGEWLSEHPNRHSLNGKRVYVGDGIKVAKEGRKMPGVKGLHQESEDVSKPEWVRGHYFSALGLLLGAGQALFATPIILKLHDGINAPDAEAEGTLVDKMALLCIQFMVKGSYVIMDAYYASAKVLTPFREYGIHLISRARISTVVYGPFCRCPVPAGPGRPRKWGTDIKLRELFAPIEDCLKTSVWLYGQQVSVYYQCFQFHWDSPDDLVLFVLTQMPNGKQIILLSSDLSLSGAQVIEAYGWRFKIEVSFRSLVQILGGFCYRFWLKSMETAARWPKNMTLANYPETFQAQVARKVEAFERFINLNAIALGLLQVLALEMPKTVWRYFPGWFRTLPKHGYPSEQIVRLSIQHQLASNLVKSRPPLLLTKLLADKIEGSQDFNYQDLPT